MTDPTPVEELRKAAPGLREWAKDVPRPDFYVAVADLLDKIAWMGELDPDMLHRVGCDEAIAIARAYLGTEGEKAGD